MQALPTPKGLTQLFVGDFDATKRPVIIDKRFCAKLGTKSASKFLQAETETGSSLILVASR